MTTPNIEELRLLAQTLEFSDAVRCSIQRAADLLQSQAERIKELEEEIGGWREDQKENIGVAFALQREVNKITSERDELREKYTDTYWALDDAARENTSLRAQLTEIAATEPVASHYFDIEGNLYTAHRAKFLRPSLNGLTPLFTRPVPAKDVDASMIKLPEPLGYLCDWGDDRYGLPNQIVYYDGPGSAIEDDWNEHPEVHLNTPIYTEAQLKKAVRDALDAEDAARAKGVK